MTHIVVTVDDGVGYLTIDRRERFNSLDVETARDLRKAGLSLSRDPQVRVVVLRGSGGVFCSGADLKYIRAGGTGEDLGYLLPPNARDERTGYGAIFKQILEYLHSTISEIRRAAKPWMAAVDGVAAAGGFGLAMACDLVVASERSSFEWAYAKTGLTGAESSTFFLPKLIGLRRAMQFALMNLRLDARAALEWGLLTAVHPTGELEQEVEKLARELASAPTEALGIAKRLLNQAAGVDRLDHHLDQELEQLAAIADGTNFQEGITAFFEKRPAVFAAK
jgi:2-(1,2-epoxy-1,2-dihydrophenyl)acetyl-CoA isomerase